MAYANTAYPAYKSVGLGPMPANSAGSFAGTPKPTTVIDAVPRYGGKTIAEGGKSPAMLASDKSEAAWKEAMGLLQKQGPYTPEVVNQLTNRRADQTAAAEAVNAEEIRNQAAARGMDPAQAIRQGQQQRQAQNVAFSGDIASQAAVQNFAAETPGRMAAAQANLGRQFGGATQNAVAGGGGTAFSAPRPIYNPGSIHQQAATMNQTRQPTNLNRPSPVAATAAANAPKKPMDLTESQYMTPFSQRPNQNVQERTPTQQDATLKSLNSPSTAVYRPLGVPASGFGGPTPAAKINTAFNPFK